MAQSLTGVLRTLLLYIALDILLLQPRSAMGVAAPVGTSSYLGYTDSILTPTGTAETLHPGNLVP